MNSTNGTVGSLTPQDISGLYQAYITNLMLFSSLALLAYTTVLSFDEEVEFIWSRRFNFPAFLYCLSRYTVLISQPLLIGLSLLPDTATLTTCNLIGNLYNAISLLPYIGVQGLLVARAYSLYPGNIWIALALGLSFFIGLFFGIYIPAAFPGCSASLTWIQEKLTNEKPPDVRPSLSSHHCTKRQPPAEIKIFNLIQIIATVLTDTLVFLATVFKVWGTWKMRRELKMGDGESGIGGLLLTQGVSRYCFVLLVTLTNAILVERGPGDVTSDFSYMQEALSIILLCQFSLDLRRRNKSHIDEVELPTMSFSVRGARNALRYLHETFITELGEHEDSDDTPPGEDDVQIDTIELRASSDSQSSPIETSKETA